ncbi:MAG: cation diffusion facilitator family transporter [bacterium]
MSTRAPGAPAHAPGAHDHRPGAHDDDHGAHDHDPGAHDHDAHDHGPRDRPHHDHHGHHHHGFGHHHGPAGDGDAARRALRWSLLLNGAFLLLEATAGFLTGSLALLSDAGHMVGDVSALLLAYAVSTLARRPPTPSRTFGLTRAEALGAFVNGLALFVVVAFIAVEAIERLTQGPPEVPGWPVLAVGAAGLAINLGSAYFLWRSASDDLNIRGALAHMLADALGSVGAMIAAALILGFGWQWADPVVSLFVAALVLWGAWKVVAASTRVLLDFAPSALDAARVQRALEALDGVETVHHVHVWGPGDTRALVTAHVVTTTGADPFEVLARADALLRARLGVAHATLQVEPIDGCPQPPCSYGPAQDP